MAARSLVKKTLDKEERERIALKYQVLSPETAFIGVVEEDGQLTDKVVKIEIKSDIVIDEPEEEKEISQRFEQLTMENIQKANQTNE